MSAFPEWEKYAVHQRRKATGCIPTSYEILLRSAGAENIDYDSFQDDFDLDRHGGKPQNHFVPVAESVREKYPFVAFTCESFAKGDGSKKLERVKISSRKSSPSLFRLLMSHLAELAGTSWLWSIQPRMTYFCLNPLNSTGLSIPRLFQRMNSFEFTTNIKEVMKLPTSQNGKANFCFSSLKAKHLESIQTSLRRYSL